MNISLVGKNALVCGSTQGIGKASAIELAGNGACIILLARNEDSLKLLVNELPKNHNQKHQYIVGDFSNPNALKEIVQEFLIKQNLVIHILVNNTGGPPGGPILNAKPDEFLSAFSNHLLCNHLLSQLVVEGMKKEKYGRIINIVSTSVKQPIKGLGVSNTTRGAVASWAKTLAGELAIHGITVNNVLPGATSTGRLSTLLEAKAKKLGIPVEAARKEWLDEIPAGRYADPSEIAHAVAFFASPAAAYINGVSLAVDGGRTACL